MVKKGFSLLELIVAIVVIAISVISLPVMVTEANKSDEDAINQDVFFHCMVIMNDIGSRYWDEQVANQDALGNGIRIVDVLGSADAGYLDRVAATNYRLGHFARSEGDMRKFYDHTLPINATAIPTTGGDYKTATNINATEQYNGMVLDMTSDGSNVNARFAIDIKYVPDNCNRTGTTERCTWDLTGGTTYTSQAQSTNLKRAKVTATRVQPAATIEYSAFFSNIGSVDIRSK